MMAVDAHRQDCLVKAVRQEPHGFTHLHIEISALPFSMDKEVNDFRLALGKPFPPLSLSDGRY